MSFVSVSCTNNNHSKADWSVDGANNDDYCIPPATIHLRTQVDDSCKYVAARDFVATAVLSSICRGRSRVGSKLAGRVGWCHKKTRPDIRIPPDPTRPDSTREFFLRFPEPPRGSDHDPWTAVNACNFRQLRALVENRKIIQVARVRARSSSYRWLLGNQPGLSRDVRTIVVSYNRREARNAHLFRPCLSCMAARA